MKIVLTGMPGSGKTTLAKKFAGSKMIEFIDSDLYIETKFGMSVNKIFNEFGELKFREYEHNALLEILQKESFILASGGGLPCYHDNMNLIKAETVSVYLNASPELLLERIIQSKGVRKRPLIQNKSRNELLHYLTKSLEIRKVFYEKADYRADASMTIADILRNDPFNL